eukprot:CAMPEP_0170507636 /NCGR_PEP_ID=MMETSP0208-20121228/59560_1 /TAXON_ID=197538 /ORGANISM="Strombidium inclinatum, Strain S3" /LENGTH=55 /DNA_ID=CAMNT_0010789969 /DNA_START=737 /DNA_END=904 /DNA_ORIENTATION=-
MKGSERSQEDPEGTHEDPEDQEGTVEPENILNNITEQLDLKNLVEGRNPVLMVNA